MNPKLGDYGFKAGGKSYVLNMGINALCLVEEEMDTSATEVLERAIAGQALGQMRMSDLRVLFWAGLQRHNPDIDREAAGDLMQLMGRGKGEKALDVIIESMRRCSPDAETSAKEAGEAGEDPQLTPAESGTGTPSS